MDLNEYVYSIKNISRNLISLCGYDDDYNIISLNNMRIFHQRIPNLSNIPMFLSWDYYQLLILVDSYQQFVYYLNLTIIDRLSVNELKIKIMGDEYNKVSKKKRNKFVNGKNIVEFDVLKYITDSVVTSNKRKNN